MSSATRVRRWLVAAWATLVILLGVIAFVPGQGDGVSWFVLSAIPMVVVGALLVARIPDNAVGFVLLVGGSAWVIYIAANGYARLSLAAIEAPWPGEYLAAWLGAWTGSLLPLSLAVLVLLFPDGTAAGWRRVLLAGLGALAGSALVGAALLWGLPASHLTDFELVATHRAYGFVDIAFLLGFLAVVPAAISLQLRYRNGSGIERQQIKWLLAAAFAFAVTFLVGIARFEGIGFWTPITAVAMGLIPIAVAVAVTRYRLYEIDRIVSRAAVYAVVVGVLGLVFAAGAVWVPSLLPFEDNSLAVAASTLVVFFLFNPLRRRVQRFVDRRFYRSRYDAQQVADQLAGRVRDQLDPDAVAIEWVEVVRRALQPAVVSVWVQEET
jgi:hypothetical protein